MLTKASKGKRRISLGKSKKVSACFDKNLCDLHAPRRASFMEGRMAKIAWLVNVDAFFDKELHGFCVLPTNSDVQCILTLRVRGINVLKIYALEVWQRLYLVYECF